MKKVLIGALASVLFATAASAAGRQDAVKDIAQVVAASQICQKLEVNKIGIVLLARTNGIDFDRDQPELMKEVAQQAAPWQGKSADAACVAGMLLYGPNGTNVPGLLDFK